MRNNLLWRKGDDVYVLFSDEEDFIIFRKILIG